MVVQGYIDLWIGKRFLESLSYIYYYIPAFLMWVILILRNNSLKKASLLFCILACLLLSGSVLLRVLSTFSIFHATSSSLTVVWVTSFIVFSLLLFKCKSFFFITLLEVLLTLVWYANSFPYFIEILFACILSYLFYRMFYICCKKFALETSNFWITEQYTRSGYLISDIHILNSIVILTYFLNLLLICW